MSAPEGLVAQLLGMPGGPAGESRALLHRAAQAHQSLLVGAADDGRGASAPSDSILAGIRSLLERIPSGVLRDAFLLDPTFVESLHAAASCSPSLTRWHRGVTDFDDSVAPTPFRDDQHLGNALLELLLRDDPYWRGNVTLQTDRAGRLRFPLCDWSISLGRGGPDPGAVLANECVACSLGRHDVRMALSKRPHDCLLVMPRQEWLRLLVENDERIDGRRISCAQGAAGLRFYYAGRIPGWQVRYDPVGIQCVDRHAGLTGGLVLAALRAIALHAPNVVAEFNGVVATVRSWDVPSSVEGTLQSFSDPTLPRVMGLNVPYSVADEPLLPPFCFTWFGHELGHTKSYLFETILHVDGHLLTPRHGEFSDTIPRYGRKLPVRTLLQIPYTHLYEWMLMIGFMEGKFSELPWTIEADPIAHTEDIRQEVDEAFDRIDRDVPLSPAGHALLARQHELYGAVLRRWLRLRSVWNPNRCMGPQTASRWT